MSDYKKCAGCGMPFERKRNQNVFCGVGCRNQHLRESPRRKEIYGTVEERLQKRARASATGCLIWTGSVNGNGYGSLRYVGKSSLAHRVSWLVSVGTIPDGLCVLHKCDTPACINPAHLFLGTHADNMADMRAKGRDRKVSGDHHPRRLHPEKWKNANNFAHLPPGSVRGERNPRAKLTQAKVDELRQRHSNGESIYSLAKEVQMDKSSISDAVRGVTWK